VISTYPGKVAMTHGFRSALRERTEPLLLIDLGMPPAFSPEHDLVRYIGIDELAAAADARPSPTVDQKLKEDAQKSWRRLETPVRTSEVIAALTAVANQAADEEVARFAQRLRSAEDPERLLRQLAHTVARRVLHPPISYLSSGPAEAVEVLAEAFGVDGD
jgi:glutamyl-tRNA reductase